jgi:hypothetical protein
VETLEKMTDVMIKEVLNTEMTLLYEDWRPVRIPKDVEPFLAGKVSLKTGEVLPLLSSGGLDWNYNFANNINTNRLYFYSLEYCGELATAYEKFGDKQYLELAVRIVTSFFDFISEQKNAEKIEKINSTDHAHSIRSRVFIKLLEVLRKTGCPDEILLKRLVENLYAHACWLYDDNHHAKNNHGVMTDFALIQTAVKFRKIEELSTRWLEKSQQRLKTLILQSFDKDGLNNENTIGYHRYNLLLYKRIVEYLEHYGIKSVFTDTAVPIIKKAEEALCYCVRQDGSVPPIGDSPILAKAATSRNQSRWFKESNFLVIKNDNFYLSLICGPNSRAHKHVDETSITLRYKEEDIIVDGGSYNYDRQNPLRKCLESCRGHSGIYVNYLDGVLSGDYIKNYLSAAGITNFVENQEYAEADCFYELLKGKIKAHRYIRVNFPDEIVIIDFVHGDGCDEFIARQQFLFHPELQIVRREDDKLDLKGKKVNAQMLHLSPSKLEIFCGEQEPIYRGWYSPQNNKAIPAFGVDFIQNQGNERLFITVIKLYEDTRPEFKPVDDYLRMAGSRFGNKILKSKDIKTKDNINKITKGKKILIFGSSATRDIFRLHPHNVQVVDYFARSSLVSLNSAPLKNSENFIRLDSEFQRRMVIRDISKSFFEDIKALTFDYLLIDFIDERFNLLINGQTVITKSSELVKSCFLKNINKKFHEVSRFNLDQSFWRAACDVFIEKINVKPERVILLKAFWAETFLGKDGIIKPFDAEWGYSQEIIKKYNELLNMYYDYFVKQCTGCYVFEYEAVADETHVWGLSPFHYNKTWYDEMRKKLDSI